MGKLIGVLIDGSRKGETISYIECINYILVSRDHFIYFIEIILSLINFLLIYSILLSPLQHLLLMIQHHKLKVRIFFLDILNIFCTHLINQTKIICLIKGIKIRFYCIIKIIIRSIKIIKLLHISL